MGDGFRNMRINSQERAISPDINRAQSFIHQDIAELLRQLLNTETDDNDPGVSTEFSSVGTPLRAEIINGGLVRPIGGTLDLTVDPMLMMALAPDGAPDESNYKYLRDVGVPSAGVLAIGANASGSIRIDLVECRVNPTPATVVDSRDIFNETTGLFTATSVTKELKGQLEYRVRAGTPAAGIPALVAGWLPLCVASVPDGTINNDTVTFWDVRPLINDRANGPMANNPTNGIIDCNTTCLVPDNTHANLVGSAEAILAGRRVGGTIRSGVPGGTGADVLNVYDPINQDTGTVTFGVLGGNAHVYLATPFGLPRWACYTDGPANRVPRAPKGLPIVSETVPLPDGTPSVALALPTSTGLGGTTSEAICVDVVRWGGNVAALNPHRTIHKCSFGDAMLITGAYNVLHANRVDFHLRDQDWPQNTKAVYVMLQIQSRVNAGASITYENDVLSWNTDDLSGDLDELQGCGQVILINKAAGATNLDFFTYSGMVRVPLPRHRAGMLAPTSPRVLQWALNAGVINAANMLCSVKGFEF